MSDESIEPASATHRELTHDQWRDLTAKAARRGVVYALLAAGAFLAYRAGHVSGCFGLGVGSALAVLALFHLAGAVLGRYSAQKAEIEREKAADAAAQLPDSGPVVDRWLRLRAPGRLPRLRTPDGGDVEIRAGADAAYRFAPVSPRVDDVVFLRLETRIRDANGRWWRVDSLVEASRLHQPIRPDDDLSDVDRVDTRFWNDAPPAWRDALTSRCLLTDVSELIDTRERYRLRVGDAWQIVMLKYQGPTFDISWIDGESDLLVRVQDLMIETWEVDPWRARATGQEPQRVDVDDDRDLVFRLPREHLSLLHAPEQHFRFEDRETFDRDEVASFADEPPVAEPSEAPAADQVV